MNSVDVERLMMERLDDLGYTDTVVPDGDWDDIYPIIVINKLPAGTVDDDGFTDRSLVVVMTIGRDRDQAWQTALEIDKRILNDGECFNVILDGFEYLVEPTGQQTAPALEPDINPDPRFLDASYTIPVSLRF